MKKINNKGFTLIELLAVVVIILAISVMAISSISSAIERNKAKQDDAKKSIIIGYAKLYYDQHKNGLPSSGCIELGNLNLTTEEKTDAYGNEFNGAISYNNGGDFKYVDDANNCS